MRSLSHAARGLLALACASIALASPAAAQDYDMCGTIVPGVECQRLFQDTNGTTWLLDDFQAFQVGDFVHVTGTMDPACISFCFVPCIHDNTIGPCADPTTPYCSCDGVGACQNSDPAAGCANSTGSGALLSGTGSASVGNDDLFLTAQDLPANQPGIFYMGPAQTEFPFGDGPRCVAAGGGVPVFRFPVQTADGSGTMSRGPIVGFAQANFPPAGQIQPGDTWNFQAWYRDPTGPCGSTFNLSNGVSATFGF